MTHRTRTRPITARTPLHPTRPTTPPDQKHRSNATSPNPAKPTPPLGRNPTQTPPCLVHCHDCGTSLSSNFFMNKTIYIYINWNCAGFQWLSVRFVQCVSCKYRRRDTGVECTGRMHRVPLACGGLAVPTAYIGEECWETGRYRTAGPCRPHLPGWFLIWLFFYSVLWVRYHTTKNISRYGENYTMLSRKKLPTHP